MSIESYKRFVEHVRATLDPELAQLTHTLDRGNVVLAKVSEYLQDSPIPNKSGKSKPKLTK